MAAKVMTGARAILSIAGQKIGTFSNVSYAVQYDAAPIYTLGAYAPRETVFTAMEPVNFSCSGWRIIGNSPFTQQGGSLPKLQDLMNAEYITIAVFDRSTEFTDKPIAVIGEARITGFSTNLVSRSPQELTISGVGILFDDESTVDQGNRELNTVTF